MKTELPVEIVTMEILARLPAKSLMRFKCVSKSWYALIKNPNFINTHRVFHNNTHHLLVNGVKRGKEGMLSIFSDETVELESYFDLSFPLKDKRNCNVHLVSWCSINGIICLLPDYSTVIIMNPATRESKFVTQPSDPNSDDFLYKQYGFGYDPITDDYKVVSLVRSGFSLSHQHSVNRFVEVYSLRSDCWRKLDDPINWFMRVGFSCTSVFVNGMIHWPSYNNKSYDRNILLSFDVSTEIFCTTVFPFQEGCMRLARVKESIAIVSYRHLELGLCCDVWILGEVGAKDSWTKHLSVGPFLDVVAPIGAGENGEIFLLKSLYLDDTGVVSSKSEVICYDPNTQMLRNLGLTIFSVGGTSRVAIYSESIVSLQRNN